MPVCVVLTTAIPVDVEDPRVNDPRTNNPCTTAKVLARFIEVTPVEFPLELQENVRVLDVEHDPELDPELTAAKLLRRTNVALPVDESPDTHVNT